MTENKDSVIQLNGTMKMRYVDGIPHVEATLADNATFIVKDISVPARIMQNIPPYGGAGWTHVMEFVGVARVSGGEITSFSSLEVVQRNRRYNLI